MSNYNKIFHKVPIKVQNRSGFNKSHDNFFTAKVGTLMPVLVDDVLPNTSVHLKLGAEVQLPPMATDFYGKVRGKFEAFFVPNRLLYGGWQELITHQDDGSGYPPSSNFGHKARFLPTLVPPSASHVAKGTLADMLGVKVFDPHDSVVLPPKILNPLPFLAYHKIWDDWYRDSRIQVSCFIRDSNGSDISGYVANLPYRTSYADSPEVYSGINLNLADQTNIFSLRQRNWARDYFTNATAAPQMGTASKIVFNTSGEKGEFTMAQLYAANALQQWAQINNLAGNRYADQIKAHFGVLPSDAVLDRCIYLGSQSVDVYNKSVYQTSPDNADDASSQNPFKGVGSKFANSIGVKPLGNGMLVNNFRTTEHGFIFVMFSLVPEASYSSGMRRYLSRNQMSDFAFPELASMGDQPISQAEIAGSYTDWDSTGTFGYTQRYSEYKYMQDEVHGLLRDGESLQHFALQRSFDESALTTLQINSEFLEIPTDYMNQVGAVADSVSEYGCWAAVHFDYKIATPLPAYSIPTLCGMNDSHTEIIDNGGRRL